MQDDPRRSRRRLDVYERDADYDPRRSTVLGRLDLGSRLSWSGIFAGLLVALAVQLALSAMGVWIGFGLADVTDIDALADVSTTVGIWIGISALVSVFIAALMASWIAGSATWANGVWHGLTVWGLITVAAVLMSALGVSGVLGFAITPSAALNAIPGIDAGANLTQATTVSATFAGWFLFGLAVSLAAALLGGWLGTRNAGKRAMTRSGEDVTDREAEERRRAA